MLIAESGRWRDRAKSRGGGVRNRYPGCESRGEINLTRRIILASVVIAVFAINAAAVRATPAAVSNARLDELDHEIQQLEDVRAIKTLQRAYGYYTDRALWSEVADLFADDATLEMGADGVYVGKPRILEYLRRLGGGRDGLSYGELHEHLQLQPVVHIEKDGLHAQARWRDVGMLGEYGKSAAWSEGVFENEYVKRNDVWMIHSAHLYVTFVAPYQQGWARLKPTSDWRSQVAKDFPPDRPPTARYGQFPQMQVVAFHYRNPADPGSPESESGSRATHVAAMEPDGPAAGSSQASTSAAYEHRVQLLRDHDEIENLQGIYGYYFDKSLWDEVAKLFAHDATFEDGQRGVYIGRDHIRKALQLFGPQGPRQGQLNNYMQLQPVIHVSEDGKTAKARWRAVIQLASPNADGQWGEGTYENEYAREGGVWKISKLHFYVTGMTDYDLMWNKGSIPMAGPSAVLPPDKPATEIYRSLPGVYLPPFHYAHPVTGKPIDSHPPADSLLGRQ
jgi:SnoaL-like domain